MHLKGSSPYRRIDRTHSVTMVPVTVSTAVATAALTIGVTSSASFAVEAIASIAAAAVAMASVPLDGVAFLAGCQRDDGRAGEKENGAELHGEWLFRVGFG